MARLRIGSGGLFFALLAGPLVVLGGIVACETDNGDTTHGPDIGTLPDAGGRRKLPDGAIVEADGAPVQGDDDDDDDDDDTGPGACTTGLTAVLAGNDTTLSGAVRTGDGAWTGGAIAGGAAKSKPALVAFGAGFLAATRGADDKLQSLTASGTAWSAPAVIGLGLVKGPPSLTVAGTRAHLVYTSDSFFKHGIYEGTSWNAADAPVGTGTGAGEFSFGTFSGGLAAVGSEVVFAENGGDNGLYARTYGSAWSAAVPVFGAGTVGSTGATPEIAPISAGKSDLVIVYAYKKETPASQNAIAFATRQPAETEQEKKWGNAETQYVSGVLTAEKFFLTAISATSVILTFRGDDGNAYYTQGSANGDAVEWTSPAAIGGAPTAVDTAPAVAKGACGDDAVFAYATASAVSTVSLKAGAWSTPSAVTGTTGTHVAIATK
ncbi:MAG: hypothetical protein KIT84_29750 [Labilithrix sp.]|nr:hypothetical protein [Labilithrix sp.]MCW5815248.1 hypothetical protein [Labilithrix sp.]